MKTILLLITVLLSVLLLCGCQQVKQDNEPPTQEEIQAKFIEIMRYMGLYLPPDYESKHERPYKVKVAEGVEIYEEDLKVYLHVYELDTNKENIPTAAEVEALYQEYDQVTYEKFFDFYDWYQNFGGAACDDYLDGIYKAYMDYKDKNGIDYKDIDSWNDFKFEDFIDFERYVTENPDYSVTNPAYQRLLKWLGLEKK